MKSGEVTSDVIRTKQGYVHPEGRRCTRWPASPPMKDTPFRRFRDALYYEKLQPALRVYLTKLREDAYIKIQTRLR